MSKSSFKQQENGNKGEELTRARIPREFWISKPFDADGVDFLVMRRFESQEQIRDARVEPLKVGSIQSKFFEGENQVRIQMSYVEDEFGNSRKGYFAFLHTFDPNDVPIDYFFSADEIRTFWEPTLDRTSYYFSLRNDRDYENFRDLPPKLIREKLDQGIADLSKSAITSMLAKFANIYGSVRHPTCKYPKYLLTRLHRAPIAIFLDGSANVSYAIEPRKDVCPSCGTYEWGYDGEGPRLLAASILTHFFCGIPPTDVEINRLVVFLLNDLPKDGEVTFGRKEIFMAFCALRFGDDPATLPEGQRTAYEQTVKRYDAYFL